MNCMTRSTISQAVQQCQVLSNNFNVTKQSALCIDTYIALDFIIKVTATNKCKSHDVWVSEVKYPSTKLW